VAVRVAVRVAVSAVWRVAVEGGTVAVATRRWWAAAWLQRTAYSSSLLQRRSSALVSNSCLFDFGSRLCGLCGMPPGVVNTMYI
jgi:hypothetical protein